MKNQTQIYHSLLQKLSRKEVKFTENSEHVLDVPSLIGEMLINEHLNHFKVEDKNHTSSGF